MIKVRFWQATFTPCFHVCFLIVSPHSILNEFEVNANLICNSGNEFSLIWNDYALLKLNIFKSLKISLWAAHLLWLEVAAMVSIERRHWVGNIVGVKISRRQLSHWHCVLIVMNLISTCITSNNHSAPLMSANPAWNQTVLQWDFFLFLQMCFAYAVLVSTSRLVMVKAFHKESCQKLQCVS